MPHEVTVLLGWLIESCVVWCFRTAWIWHLIMSASVNGYTALIILRWSPIDLVLLTLGILFNCCLVRLKFILHIDLIHHLLLFVEIPRHQILSSWILRVYLGLFKHLASSVLSDCWIICSFIVNRVSTRIFPSSVSTDNWSRTNKVLFVRVHLIIIDAPYLVWP
jgi:hypothetical protein